MATTFSPVPLAINDRSRQVVWLTSPWGLCLPERGKTTLCNLSNHVWALKLLAGPQCPKKEPLALTEYSWKAWSRTCWWLPGALSGAVLLVLCVLYCWIGRERCVLKRHYYICRLKCSQALISVCAPKDFSCMFTQDIVHQVALQSSADVSWVSLALGAAGSLLRWLMAPAQLPEGDGRPEA